MPSAPVKPEVAEIRGYLIPGHHQSILEFLETHDRRTAIKMLMGISEACIGSYPLVINDYSNGTSDRANAIGVKMMLSKKHYPKLYALYNSLERGIKNVAVLNLINRHALICLENPTRVNDLIRERSTIEPPVVESVESTTIGSEDALSVHHILVEEIPNPSGPTYDPLDDFDLDL